MDGMGFTDSELEFERGFLAGSFYRYIGESFAERPTSFVTAAGGEVLPLSGVLSGGGGCKGVGR